MFSQGIAQTPVIGKKRVVVTFFSVFFIQVGFVSWQLGRSEQSKIIKYTQKAGFLLQTQQQFSTHFYWVIRLKGEGVFCFYTGVLGLSLFISVKYSVHCSERKVERKTESDRVTVLGNVRRSSWADHTLFTTTY